ncbi:hypothetical protein OG741_17975 [Streptomyces sp. NBC_01410]|uniref:hypothetical protein n=1 Tax=Streptomyces sp. NBC_01410 TaxID=2903856 RepID=UPI00324F91D0
MERRRLLHAGAGFALASVAGQIAVPGTAKADPAGTTSTADPAGRAGATSTTGDTSTTTGAEDCSGPPLSTYGVASLTAAIVGMTTLGDRAYVVARGQSPPLLGEIDLTSRTLTRTVRLGRGEGGWAATVSGGQVYLGTYPFPDIYRFDPATGEVKLIGTVGPSGGFVWCLTTAPDGTVYAGTSPRGEVWEYKPATGTLRNLGNAVPGQQYVRAITADDRYVYAGTLPSGYVVAYDRTTGVKTNLTPTPYGGAAAMIARGGRVIAALTKSLVDMAPDGSDARVIATPAAERLIDAMTMTEDGTLYCVGRPTGTVYRRDGDTLVPVVAPVSGDEHRALIPLDGGRTLLGGAGSGRLWWLDVAGGQSDILELIDAGLSGPDPVQSMTYGSHGSVHVGGHFSITTHRPERGTPKRVRVAGEPKQLRVIDGKVYAAMYPSTEVIELDPDRGRVKSLGFIDHEQQRPTDFARFGRERLLLSSAPGVGLLKGALTVVDTWRCRLQVYRDVIVDQSVMSVALDDRHGCPIAYLAGDTWGGGSVPPTRPSATIAAFDLRRREVLWEVAPVEGYASIQHIEVCDGVLYGVYKRLAGAWFAMDLQTRTVLRTGKLPSYGELSVHRGQVYASVFGGLVYRLGPGLDEPQVVLGGLGDGWYNPPQLAWERSSWYAWGVAGRDLARLRLNPSCPSGVDTRVRPPDEAILESLLAN